MRNSKLLKPLLIVSTIIVVIIVAIILYFVFANQNLSYSEIEQRMVEAAEKYYSNNQDGLPTLENKVITVDATTLSSSEYMKSLSEYTDESVQCSGQVSIYYTGEDIDYLYVPFLNCGENYTTQTLADQIIEDGQLYQQNQSGIYQVGEEWIFKGETPNNYVEFNNTLWRIIRITSDNRIVLIATEGWDNIVWDYRYNITVDSNVGMNDYSLSAMQEVLTDYYNGIENKDKLSFYDVCNGSRSPDDTSIDGSVDCTSVIANQKVGLLPIYEYWRGSLDANCATNLNSCQNYNYLINNFGGWKWSLQPPSNGNTSSVLMISGLTVLEEDLTKRHSVYPVVYLQSGILYEGGTGTYADPYIVS